MKIAYDHQIFVSQRYGGISRYFVYMIAALRDMGHVADVWAPIYRNVYLQEERFVLKGWFQGYYYRGKLSKHFLLNLSALLSLLMRSKSFDVLHETYYGYFPRLGSDDCRVTTVHDMTHELYPLSLPLYEDIAVLMRWSLKHADHILCVSRQTRDDLVALYRVDPALCSVVYLGSDHVHKWPVLDVDKQNILRSKVKMHYILYVGRRDAAYKNFKFLIDVYAAAGDKLSSYTLVAFGGGSFTATELMMIQSAGIDRFQQIGGGDDVLRWLYEHADVLVYPSFYEGFGLPPLEAMQLGCPVIAARASCLPEILENGVIYVDPSNPVSAIPLFQQVLDETGVRESLIQRAYAQSSKYTWKRCAEETLLAYEKAKVHFEKIKDEQT